MKYPAGILLFCLLATTVYGQSVSAILNELKSDSTDSLKIESYNALIRHYRYSHSDSAIFYANQGLAYAQKNNYKPGKAIMLFALGQINETHGFLDLAKGYYEDARKTFSETGYVQGVAGTTNGLGVVAGRTGNYEEATRHFLEALHLYEEIENKKGVVQTYIKLGVVNDHIGNLDKALEYYLKAEVMNNELPSSTNSLTLLNNIGIVYGRRNDIPTALKYFRKGLKQSDVNTSIGVHIALLSSLGNAYHQSGKPDSALYFQHQVLSKAKSHHLPEDEARALVNIALLIKDENPSKSLHLLEEALVITERIRQLTLKTEVYEAMIQLHKNRNNFKEALLIAEKRELLKDSLFSIDKSKEIARLQTIYELTKREGEIKSLAILNEKSIVQRNIMIVVALIAIIIIGIVWYYNNKISRLNKRLIEKQTELEASNNVKDKLFSILGHDLRAPLSRVIGLLEVLGVKYKDKDPEESEIIEKLKQQSVNTLETLDNLLMWGKSQLKGLRLNQQTILAKDQIQKNIFLHGDYAVQKNVKLIDKTPDNLLVHVDFSHFDFIVRNLLSNAIKFSHSGGAVELNGFTSSGQEVIFTIKDTGVGIPKDLQNQIFASGNESIQGTWNEKGTGIGLMLCQEYITENGGRMWLESEEGKGSTFYFSFLKGNPQTSPSKKQA